jgi:lipopolysaccharide transport system ATP-binding protein
VNSVADAFAIRAEGLGKKYRISHQLTPQRYTALRDVIAGSVRRVATAALTLGARKHGSSGGRTEDFWALRDISFDLQHGGVLGIMGRNGAGKSTLLKVLSRITEPTEGRVRLRGRVASLLEVGTGFHPELTGRENIYLNGAILGMSRAEIRGKFDEIVAFAEVEKFLDTPVKRFSSGMYVRLAFAVAAHLEPEILVVDEVLSVGDAAFQHKCLGKVKDVSVSGRTVLYVSHNLASVTRICSRGIVLDRGRIVTDAPVEHAVASYLQLAGARSAGEPHVLFAHEHPRVDADRIDKVEVLDRFDRPKPTILPMDFVKLRVWFTNVTRIPQGSVVIEIDSLNGTPVLKLETNPAVVQPLALAGGGGYIDCCIESLPMMEGQYFVAVGLALYGVRALTWHADAGRLVIAEPPPDAGCRMSVDQRGVLVVRHSWHMSAEAGRIALDPAGNSEATRILPDDARHIHA